ncbi:MAG: hypothetical protein BWY89_01774 [Bacteroidetes bacterium ADurb.BinA012]|nr:MAG: hypothetical protein BWY89_01774 [Bacteroidetes bacterium ADurb.BinA012]
MRLYETAARDNNGRETANTPDSSTGLTDHPVDFKLSRLSLNAFFIYLCAKFQMT